MIERRSSCSCGKLKLVCLGEAVRVSMCHCLECQKRTGSVFGVQARYAQENVSITGESTAFTRYGDSGGEVTFHFCPACGSTVYWTLGGLAGFYVVAVGSFADNTYPEPSVSVYHTRSHAWTFMPKLSVEQRG